jgi:squalene cyclase
MTWPSVLRYDPLPPLLASSNLSVRGLAERELVGRVATTPVDPMAEKAIGRLARRQRPNGSWKHSGGQDVHFDYVETYRNLGILVEKYSLGREHPGVARAAGFLLSLQTAEGDIRGIYWNQLSPNYTAGVMELLIKAGYGDAEPIRRGFDWLLSIRQDDGG